MRYLTYIVKSSIMLYLSSHLVSCGSNSEDLQTNITKPTIPIEKPEISDLGYEQAGLPKIIDYSQPLDLADPYCTVEEAKRKGNIGIARIWIHDESQGGLKQVKADLSQFSRLGLESHIISQTYTHIEIKQSQAASILPTSLQKTPFEFNGIPENLAQQMQNQSDENGRLLTFCRDTIAYPPDSLENVALASALGIQKAYQVRKDFLKFVHKKQQDDEIKKLVLLIHPRILIPTKQQRQNNTYVIFTDNAFFAYTEQLPIVAILPHSKMWLEANHNTGRFWEQVGIISHEFGHYLFLLHAWSLVSYSKLQENLAGLNLFNTARRVNTSTVIGAFNEGSADLVSYQALALEPEISYEINIGKDEIKSRDLLSFEAWYSRSSGQDGSFFMEEKKIDQDFLKIFFSPTNFSQASLRRKQDIHYLGAILAYGMNQLFSTSTRLANLSKKERHLQKSIMLLSWFESLDKSFQFDSRMLKPKEYLRKIILQGIIIASEKTAGKSHVNQSQCALIEKIFPTYYEDWEYDKNFPAGCF